MADADQLPTLPGRPGTLNAEQTAGRSGSATRVRSTIVKIMYGTVDHLVELRKRIFMVLGALLVGGIVAGVFANTILEFL